MNIIISHYEPYILLFYFSLCVCVCISYFYVQGNNFNLTFRWRKSILPDTEIIRNVWNPNFHYCVPMSLPPVASLSKKNLINIVTSYLLAIHSFTGVVLRLVIHGSVHRSMTQ